MTTAALRLAARTLRVEARSSARAWFRAGFALFLVLALAVALARGALFGAPGLRFYTWLAWGNFAVLSFLGVTAFSSVITEEREESMLPLLRLAGMGGASILLGKSVGRLVAAATLLAVQLPFAVLCVTMGGVSQHQVLSGYVILGSYAAMLFGVGLLCSTVCRRTGNATRLAFAIVGVLLFGPQAAGFLTETFTGLPPGTLAEAFHRWCAELATALPFEALDATTGTRFAAPLWSPPAQLELTIAAATLLAACISMRGGDRDDKRVVYRPVTPLTRPRPGSAAFEWKDFHFTAGGRRTMLNRIIVYLATIVPLATAVNASADRTQTASVVTVLIAGLLTIEVLIAATQVFGPELRWRTLPSIMICPLRPHLWIRAKMAGCISVIWPAGTSLAFAAMTLVVLGQPETVLAVGYYATIVVLAFSMTVYYSVTVRRGALTATIATIAGIALVWGGLIQACLGFAACGLGAPFAFLIAAAALNAHTETRLRRAAAE